MVVELIEEGFSDVLGEVPPRLGEREIVRTTPRGHVFVGGAIEGVGERIKFAGVDWVDEMLIDEIIHNPGHGFSLIDGADVLGGVLPNDGNAPAQFFPGRNDSACHELGKIFS